MATNSRPIVINMQGDDSHLRKALKRASGQVEKFGDTVGRIGKAAGVAFAATATAVVGKGITAFADFEKGMNEVMTLLPEAGADTFNALSDQVKDFAKEFGVLPDEVIPSLYQALSAGVPEDNVFEFLEVAQMAAKGGVTELETAVDGISSVVNAYGEDVISATQASDLMFTAVRLGKTNFEELSGSLFQVAPIAASLGINFQDVTTALANLTAKGVPTSVAATQLKGAFAELGKEGTKADIAFRDLAGMGLTQFLETEGNMASALQIISDGAADAGISVLDMFGSVEAGQAVLALTAGGIDDYTATLLEMDGSAGATQTAFETMDTGLAASFDRIKSNLSVLAIEIGEKVAPYVETATGFILTAFENLGPAVETAKDFVIDLKDEVLDRATPVFEALGDAFNFIAEKVTAAFNAVSEYLTPGITAAKDAVVELFKKGLDKLTEWFNKTDWKKVGEALGGAFIAARDAVLDFVREVPNAFRTTIGWIKENRKWLIVLGGAVGGLVVGWLAYKGAVAAVSTATKFAAVVQGLWNAAMLLNPVGIILVALVALAGALTAAYFQFEGVRDVVDGIARFFRDNILPIFEVFWDSLVSKVTFFWDQIKEMFTLVKALFTGDFAQVWESLKTMVGNVIDQAIEFFIEFPLKVINAILPLIADIGKFGLDIGVSLLKGLGDWYLNSFIPWWLELPGKLWNTIKGMATKIGNIGADIGGWLLDSLVNVLSGVGSAIAGAASWVADLGKQIVNGVIDFINSLIDDLNDLFEFTIPLKIVPDIHVNPPDIPHIPKLAQGGIVSGAQAQLAMIGDGGEPEAIIPLSKANQMGFGGGSTINLTVNTGVGDPLAIGNQVVSVLKQWERANGSIPISTTAV
jgi:TP901 family phage tail tape measure protein